jgi:hypothetical protein
MDYILLLRASDHVSHPHNAGKIAALGILNLYVFKEMGS